MDCLDLRLDRSERVHYNKTDYPAYIRQGILSHFPNYSAESHWHDDIELISILSGCMDYNINGEIVTMHQGEGVFVNSRQFHYGFSDTHQECVFICILLHPVLLCSTSYVEQKFVMPIIMNDSLSYHKLSPENPWEKKVLDIIQELFDYHDTATVELKVQSLFSALWIELYKHLLTESSNSPVYSHHLTSLRSMMSYIQSHYKEKIGLADICKTGNVGKTSCTTIFMKYTNQTPIEYLTDYRLRKSIELMRTTDLSLAEICYEVGFSGASYFTETFHKNFGCSPSVYRKNLKTHENLSDKP